MRLGVEYSGADSHGWRGAIDHTWHGRLSTYQVGQRRCLARLLQVSVDDQTRRFHHIDGAHLEDCGERSTPFGRGDHWIIIAQISPQACLIDFDPLIRTPLVELSNQIVIASSIVEFKPSQLLTKPITKRDTCLVWNVNIHEISPQRTQAYLNIAYDTITRRAAQARKMIYERLMQQGTDESRGDSVTILPNRVSYVYVILEQVASLPNDAGVVSRLPWAKEARMGAPDRGKRADRRQSGSWRWLLAHRCQGCARNADAPRSTPARVFAGLA